MDVKRTVIKPFNVFEKKILYVIFATIFFSCNNGVKSTIESSDSQKTSSVKEFKGEEKEVPNASFRFNTFYFGEELSPYNFVYIPEGSNRMYVNGRTYEFGIHDNYISYSDYELNRTCRIDFYDAEDYHQNRTLKPLNSYSKRSALPHEKNAMLMIVEDNDQSTPVWNRIPIQRNIIKNLDKDPYVQEALIKECEEILEYLKAGFQKRESVLKGYKSEFEFDVTNSSSNPDLYKNLNGLQAESDMINDKYSKWINSEDIKVTLNDCKDPEFLTKIVNFKDDYYKFDEMTDDCIKFIDKLPNVMNGKRIY